MWASGATIEAGKCGDEPLVGDGVKQVDQWARDMVAAKNVPDSAQAETGATVRRAVRHGQDRMMGTGNFNIVLARDQMKDHPFTFGISLLPGMEAGSTPRSSVATSSSSRRAASGSTTRSRSCTTC
jgi:multiple sugar transport system substrate-binding protein